MLFFLLDLLYILELALEVSLSSLNIVVIGGGKPKRFGNDFCLKSERDGHNVFILSHTDYGNNNPNHFHANFNSSEDVVEKFNSLVEKIDKIDIFLYNTVSGRGPWDEPDFRSDSKFFDEADWLYNLRINTIIPYNLSICALKK